MSEAFDVAKVGSFGMSSTQAAQKSWQILASSRDGEFPLAVVDNGAGTPGNEAFDVYKTPKSAVEAAQKIWQILVSARDGRFPLAVNAV